MAVHRSKEIQAYAIEADERQVVIEGSEPPFARMMLICDEVGNVPREEIQSLSNQDQRFTDCGKGFHDEELPVSDRSKLQEC